jgi:hypothetical protein
MAGSGGWREALDEKSPKGDCGLVALARISKDEFHRKPTDQSRSCLQGQIPLRLTGSIIETGRP